MRVITNHDDQDNLYLVMEYASGGDTYSLLGNCGALDEKVAKVCHICSYGETID